MSDLSSLKEILEFSFSRYIKVLPQGFQLPHESQIYPSLTVSLSLFHPVRTLYQNHKPLCRSLDAIKPLKKNSLCCHCLFKSKCTPQICLELLYQEIPLKLLLSYTSKKNFIVFLRVFNPQCEIKDHHTFKMNILNRGKWGEVQFLK
jgi:hypothetical protein